jgi:hypothetical protein
MAALLFENGEFKEDHWPELSGDWDAAFKAEGYSKCQTFGNDNGISFEVWDSNTEGAFLVVFQTADASCAIRCWGWQNLIELLSKLSPIALAGAIEYGELGSPFFRVVTRLPGDEKADF